MNIVTEFGLKDLWRNENPNDGLYMHFMAGVILTPVVIGLTQVLS